MESVVIESARVPELYGSGGIHRLTSEKLDGTSIWVVRIEQYEGTAGFGVWAEHEGSGAVVPADGSKFQVRMLGAARDKAAWLAGLLRNTMQPFHWPARDVATYPRRIRQSIGAVKRMRFLYLRLMRGTRGMDDRDSYRRDVKRWEEEAVKAAVAFLGWALSEKAS